MTFPAHRRFKRKVVFEPARLVIGTRADELLEESSSEVPVEERKEEEPKAHNYAFDIDGVIDAFPREMITMVTALTAAAHKVYIISGVDGPKVTKQDELAKRNFLVSLGLGPEMYTDLIVIPDPHPENKVKVIEELGIGVLIDNRKSNVKAAAAAGCISLLLWNSREA